MKTVGRAKGKAWSAVLLVWMVVWVGVAGPASAITLEVTHSASATYPSAGGTVDITVTITTSGTGSLLSLGLNETIPSGWTYNSLVSGPTPVLQPAADSSSPLEFAWSTIPTFPMTLVYRVNVPAGGTDSETISGYALGMDNLGQDIESTPTSVEIDSDNPTAMPVRAWPVLLSLLGVGIVASRRWIQVPSEHSVRK